MRDWKQNCPICPKTGAPVDVAKCIHCYSYLSAAGACTYSRPLNADTTRRDLDGRH